MSASALSREDFHGLPDLRRERVELPKRSGYVFVREMCAVEMLEFSSRIKENPASAGLWLLVRSVVDESGERLFSDDQTDLIGQSLSREEFSLINGTMMRLNGLDESTEKK